MGLRKPKRIKITPVQAAIILIAVLLSLIELPKLWSGGMTLYAFDVGQADAFLFHFPDGANVLVDAGTRGTGAGLVARLRALGVEKIDIAVATHPHEDHIGGMPDVLRAFEVGRFWDSGYNHGSEIQRSMLEILRDKKIPFERPKAGYAEEIGGARIEVIAPARLTRGTRSDPNNNSLVLRFVYGDVACLMTGDMESEERAGVKIFPRAALLKVAHHGSANGTDERMLREVSPDVAILSYGRKNSYGHPHAEVTDMLRKLRIKSYATADGEIKFSTDGRTWTIERR